MTINHRRRHKQQSSTTGKIGGTAESTNIIIRATKGCVRLLLNDTYFDDIRFSGVKIAKEVNVLGVDYCAPVNTSHNGFSCICWKNYWKSVLEVIMLL